MGAPRRKPPRAVSFLIVGYFGILVDGMSTHA
jgi:hypothetical protein